MNSTLTAIKVRAVGTRLLSANSFRVSVLAATILPIFIALGMQATPLMRVFPGIVTTFYSSSLAAVFTVMGTISAAHVCSTAYLLFNPKEYVGVKNATLVLVLIPIGLFTATFIVLLAMPLWTAMIFMLIYIHYGMWHFGRQNLGVLSFVSRISRAAPMNDFERKTIMAGVIAGMFAAYSLFAPALMLNQKAFPFDVTDINSFFSSLWYVGAAINVILVPLTLWYVWTHRAAYDVWTALTYLASVFFFLPIFLTKNALFSFAAWTVAHGLQYVVFLAFHAGAKPRPVISLAFLLATVVAGYVIWQFCGHIQNGSDLFAIKAAVATITAITLVHYWVDQFLWRFNSPERRKWLATNYPFLVQSR
jgi:hypothetical protein